MKNLYLKFLNITQHNKLPVDRTAEDLLEIIAIVSKNGTPFTVTEAMSLNDIASPSTLHRKINDLLKAKLIELKQEDEDRRTKYLVPTPIALMYFHNKGKAMRSVVLSHNE